MGCIAGAFAYLPFFWGPGFFAGYILNLFRFRDARWSERLLLSVTLSVALTPILATLIARFSSLSVAITLFVFMSIAGVAIAARGLLRDRANRSLTLSRSEKIGLCFACGWACVAIASLVDMQIGDRLYVPASSFDQSVRSALAGAAVRTGVPPSNPFFYPGHGIALRYYYYWNVVCALPAKLFGVSPRLTALSGVIWSGLALASIIPLYLKYFCGETVALGKKSLIGIALLAVTGLDLIPTIVFFYFDRFITADMEWWDGQQVTSWFDSLLWVPHHVAALVACLIGFLILWMVPRTANVGDRAKAAIVAALAFASAAGLSAYVVFTFAIFLVIWTLILLRSHLLRDAGMFLFAGIVTVVVSLAYLHDLRQPGYSGEFARFYIRALESVENWADDSIPWDTLRDVFIALMLPVYYLIELGFFALVGFAQVGNYWRRPRRLLQWEWAAVVLCGVSLLVSSFLISTTGNNDLGYRGMLFAQFILLLWAVPLVYRWTAGDRRGMLRLLFHAFLWIGFLSTVYQALELRMFSVLAEDGRYVDEAPWLPHPENLGHDLFRARYVFEQLNRKLPKDAILQYNPVNKAVVPNTYYLQHQTIAGLATCGTAFGGDPFQCVPLQNKILAAFNGTRNFSMQDADRLCDDLGIDVLIAERSDRMWALRHSWVWSENPLLANEYMRVFACGRRRETIQHNFSPY